MAELERPLVLVADDAALMLVTTADALTAAGYRVEVATDGVEAIRLARQLEPDAIVLDVDMPRMSGLDALQAIRQFNPAKRPRILIMSGIEDAQVRREAFLRGCDEYIIKPCGVEAVVGALKARTPTTILR